MKVEGKTSGTVGSPRRAVLAFVFVLLLAGLGFGILAWRNPLWLVDQQIDARLRLRGVHSEFVTVNGYKMHYLVGGTGRPLVLVHGLGSRAADWANLIPKAHRWRPPRICAGLVGIRTFRTAQGCFLLHLRPGSHGRGVSR